MGLLATEPWCGTDGAVVGWDRMNLGECSGQAMLCGPMGAL